MPDYTSEMMHAATKIMQNRAEQIGEDELYHYGTPRHSGRYPYGSGERPHQHNKTNLGAQLNNVMNDLNESVKRHLELDKFKDEISNDFSNLKNQIKDTINTSKSKRQNKQKHSNDALAQEVEKVYKSKPLKDYKNESEQQIAIKKIADVSNETYDLKNRKPYKQIVSDIDSLIQDHANNLKQGRAGWTYKDGSSLNDKYEPKMIKDFQDLHADMMENLEKQGINISNITGSNNRDRQFYIISYGDPNKNNKFDLTSGACNPLWELFDDNSCASRDLFLDWYDNEFVLTPEDFYSINQQHKKRRVSLNNKNSSEMYHAAMNVLTTRAYQNGEDELMHFGILGQKWGVRRYQNEDGSLTSEGRERYYSKDTNELTEEGLKAFYDKKGRLTEQGRKRLNKELYETNVFANLAVMQNFDDKFFNDRPEFKKMIEEHQKLNHIDPSTAINDIEGARKAYKTFKDYFYDPNALYRAPKNRNNMDPLVTKETGYHNSVDFAVDKAMQNYWDGEWYEYSHPELNDLRD